jgi:hypothetical protein
MTPVYNNITPEYKRYVTPVYNNITPEYNRYVDTCIQHACLIMDINLDDGLFNVIQ